jgi:hypothetical protein
LLAFLLVAQGHTGLHNHMASSGREPCVAWLSLASITDSIKQLISSSLNNWFTPPCRHMSECKALSRTG